MTDLKTKNWIIGILIGSLISTAVVGFLHEKAILPEPSNPIIHIIRDWLLVVIFVLPISWILARILPNK